MVDRSKFGKVLKEIRLEKGMTQKDLAELSGVGLRAIEDTEQGYCESMFRTVVALSRALGVPMEEFLREPMPEVEPDPEPEPEEPMGPPKPTRKERRESQPKRPRGRPRKNPPEEKKPGPGRGRRKGSGKPDITREELLEGYEPEGETNDESVDRLGTPPSPEVEGDR